MTAANNPPTGSEFLITDAKQYIPVITLSEENDKNILEQLKSGLKRTVKWHKYRSQIAIQPQNNKLNYLIYPTYTKVSTLFVLSFERIRENNAIKDYIDYFSHYYVPNIEIKDFDVLIHGKTFFYLPVKKEKEADEKLLR